MTTEEATAGDVILEEEEVDSGDQEVTEGREYASCAGHQIILLGNARKTKTIIGTIGAEISARIFNMAVWTPVKHCQA